MPTFKLAVMRAIAALAAGVLLAAVVVDSPSPAHAATFTVNSSGDARDAIPGDGICATAGGECTLRAALLEAGKNAFPVPNTINFSVQHIAPASPLPAMFSDVIIDGTTVGRVEIDGSNSGSIGNGLSLGLGTFTTSCVGSIVKGLAIHSFPYSGIRLHGQVLAQCTTLVEDNFLGTDITGTVSLPNGWAGLSINYDSSQNIVRNNVISGNAGDGIRVYSDGNIIEGNYIGTNSTGSSSIGNQSAGILVSSPADDNLIKRNTIAFNGSHGVRIFSAARTRITENWIFANGQRGIEHLSAKPPAPTLELQSSGATLVSLSGDPGDVYRLEFFSNDACDSSGYGEGQRYLWSDTLTGNASFVALFPPGQVITATATDPANNTSEFSACVVSTCVDIDGNGDSDNDDDGLCDNWEAEGQGIDSDGDGVMDLVLNDPPYNADPNHKDIFVEIDYMVGSHSHQPDPAAMSQVIKAFKKAPVENPDGDDGISLHLLADTSSYPESNALTHSSYLDFGSSFTDFDSVKSSNFGAPGDSDATREARRLAFRYAIFGHSLMPDDPITPIFEHTYSGHAEIGGNDLIVSLGERTGNVGSPSAQAGTFMHELGHTLGLLHGGDPDQGDVNYKPNYLSVMNYSFQTERVLPGRPLDYSRWQLPTLNETNLDEAKGVDGNAPPPDLLERWPETAHTYYDSATDSCLWVHSPTVGDIDWDQDGPIESSVQVAINDPEACEIPADEPLTGFDDWQHLDLDFRDDSDFGDGVHANLPDELTLDEVLLLASAADYDQDGLSNADDNCPGLANAGQEDHDSDGVGNVCDNCPTWPNSTQSLPAWLVPANDPDCDGTSSADKAAIGTDPTEACPLTVGTHDAWPADFDMNRTINTVDVFFVLPPYYGTTVPPTDARRDLVPDGVINTTDVFKVLPPVYGSSC